MKKNNKVVKGILSSVKKAGFASTEKTCFCLAYQTKVPKTMKKGK